jgi:hypothetical protein
VVRRRATVGLLLAIAGTLLLATTIDADQAFRNVARWWVYPVAALAVLNFARLALPQGSIPVPLFLLMLAGLGFAVTTNRIDRGHLMAGGGIILIMISFSLVFGIPSENTPRRLVGLFWVTRQSIAGRMPKYVKMTACLGAILVTFTNASLREDVDVEMTVVAGYIRLTVPSLWQIAVTSSAGAAFAIREEGVGPPPLDDTMPRMRLHILGLGGTLAVCRQ